MKLLPLALFTLLAACSPAGQTSAEKAPIKVAVIGGMVMTGLWEEIAKAFEAESGHQVVVVFTGPKEVLDAGFRKGGVDLITLHSSDVATNLVADGLAQNIRPWARNELVIVGPPEDPAQIRGLSSGAEAFRKIAAKKALVVEARGTGSKTVCAHLWKQAGIEPVGDWILRDESPSSQQVLEFAAKHRAYVVVGSIPVTHGKMPRADMEILVQGDPEMRRPYVVLEGRGSKTAALLADFLVSDKCQNLLQNFASKQSGPKPIFFPIHPQPPAKPL